MNEPCARGAGSARAQRGQEERAVRASILGLPPVSSRACTPKDLRHATVSPTSLTLSAALTTPTTAPTAAPTPTMPTSPATSPPSAAPPTAWAATDTITLRSSLPPTRTPLPCAPLGVGCPRGFVRALRAGQAGRERTLLRWDVASCGGREAQGGGRHQRRKHRAAWPALCAPVPVKATRRRPGRPWADHAPPCPARRNAAGTPHTLPLHEPCSHARRAAWESVGLGTPFSVHSPALPCRAVP